MHTINQEKLFHMPGLWTHGGLNQRVHDKCSPCRRKMGQGEHMVCPRWLGLRVSHRLGLRKNFSSIRLAETKFHLTHRVLIKTVGPLISRRYDLYSGKIFLTFSAPKWPDSANTGLPTYFLFSNLQGNKVKVSTSHQA